MSTDHVVRGLWNLRFAPLQGRGLHCVLSTCVVHHRPGLCTMVHKGDLYWGTLLLCTMYSSFVLIRWCTWQFFVFDISYHLDGAQYDVVSLDEVPEDAINWLECSALWIKRDLIILNDLLSCECGCGHVGTRFGFQAWLELTKISLDSLN